MKKFRLIIDSDSDFDYKLCVPSILFTYSHLLNYKIKKVEDKTLIVVDYYCDKLQFIEFLFEFFTSLTIETSSEFIFNYFESGKSSLLYNLNKDFLESPVNWFSGNQSLIITFEEIDKKTY